MEAEQAREEARENRRRSKLKKPTKAQLGIRNGQSVAFTDDNGVLHKVTAKSDPWQLGCGAWVILLEGITGGYSLLRVHPLGQAALAKPSLTPAVQA